MNEQKTVDPRRQNRQKILRYIFQNVISSRPQIANDLKMSMPTVLQNVQELLRMGLIRESGQFESTGGRRAAKIEAVPDARLSAGMDITRGYVCLVLVDLSGRILHQERVPCCFSNTPEYFERLGTLFRQMIREEDAAERLVGVGVSVPGILDADGGVIADSHALGLHNLPCSMISGQIPWPCLFFNDANAAGLAELRQMEPDSTMVYLSLSNSVGGAVFFGGSLYEGLNRRSGEFGHMRLFPGGRTCYCGQDGCLDAYCSALALQRFSGCRLEEFFEKVTAGDQLCEQIWNEYLTNLAYAVNTLNMCFDCTVVLGGYVGAFLEPWAEELRRRAARLCLFDRGEESIRICRYRREASAFGAAMQPVERFFREI